MVPFDWRGRFRREGYRAVVCHRCDGKVVVGLLVRLVWSGPKPPFDITLV